MSGTVRLAVAASSTSIGNRRIACVPTMTSVTPGARAADRPAFLLRDTARHRDNRIVAGFGGHDAQFAEARIQLVLGMLAHTARVDHDDVRVRRIVGRLVPRLLEQPRHPLRVVHVHLAAEGFDQVLARH